MPPATPAAPLLDEQICFALYSASRALTARYRDILAPLGLTYPQYLAMTALWEAGSTTVTQLGELLRLDSGTLSPLLRRLESAGLVTRTRIPRDERSVEIALTPAGVGLRSAASEIPTMICAATGLDADALRALHAQIATLAQHVRAAT